MNDSILNSVKLQLGILPEYTVFDQQLILAINTAFSILHQLGVGPKDGSAIEDDTNRGDEVVTKQSLNMVKSYVFLKVKLLFDPPATSFVLDAYNKQLAEMEWRINSEVETNV